MSHPSQPNPYGQPPPYGYPSVPPQQPPPQHHPAPGYQAPGYPSAGYPGGYPQYPGGMPPTRTGMPGIVVTARVLLFVAGGLWLLLAMLGVYLMAESSKPYYERPAFGGVSDDLYVVGVVLLCVSLAMGALHITVASMFGRGRTGVRVMAIITAALNTLAAGLAFVSSVTSDEPVDGFGVLIQVLWLVTAILTLVFLCVRAAGHWFNRPQF
ncbi:hypothetical protein [Streptomyces chumphonensis]|uniref:hypothetical protein n=1 Tax=Streptomyces chumphonensis TaxID=1214925 RepID=UPI003D71B2A3